jgi:hypothetical protein
LYKISLRKPGCAIFRQKSLEWIKDFCHQEAIQERAYSVYHKAFLNRDVILNLCLFLENYDKDTWSKRIENQNIDFYTNDVDFYKKFSLEFYDYIIHQFEPDADNIEILNNSHNTVAVKKFPHNRYQFKAYLLPHKMAKDSQGKQKYITWLKSLGDRVTCTKAVEKWFMHTDWNWDRRYILVEDEHTLLMLKLRNPEVVGRIYNYVLSDK